MLIADKYLRKLVWGIGFALFCLVLYSIYNILLKRRNKVVFTARNAQLKVFSFADIFIFLIMTVTAGIRLNVGSDYYNYFVRFNYVTKNMSLKQDILSIFDGYRLLSFITKQFTDNEYAIFTVVAVIIYGYLFVILNRETSDKATAFGCYLFLGYFANSLNILKQCIAMMLVMSFYLNLNNKKIVRSIVFALLAFWFHYSSIFAIVIIAVFTIYKLNPTKNLLRISILTGVVFVAFLPQLINLLFKFVPSASGYDVYVNWRRNGQIRLIIAVAGMSAIYIFLLYHIVKNKNIIKQENENRYFEISFLMIGLCINIASIRIWIVQRIALYFYQFIILIIPTMLEALDESQRKKIKKILFTSMFVYLIFSGIFLGENEYYSYNTIFSGDNPIYDADFNRMFN